MSSSSILSYHEYKDQVCNLVESQIKDKSWYRGVCIDSIQDSFDAGRSVEDAAESARSETYMWDAE